MLLHNGIAILEHDTHLSKWVVEHNRLDFDQNIHSRIHLNIGDVVIDAGANIGCYSYGFLKQVSKDGKVYCFEPSNESYECLSHNLSNYPNVILSNKALSDKVEYCNIIRESNNVGMNFCDFVKSGEIQTTTIDSLELERLNFIKIDVEGCELKVLQGGLKTILKHKPVMLIEINDHTFKKQGINRMDVFALLNAMNYSISNIYQGQSINGEQLDIICHPNEK